MRRLTRYKHHHSASSTLFDNLEPAKQEKGFSGHNQSAIFTLFLRSAFCSGAKQLTQLWIPLSVRYSQPALLPGIDNFILDTLDIETLTGHFGSHNQFCHFTLLQRSAFCSGASFLSSLDAKPNSEFGPPAVLISTQCVNNADNLDLLSTVPTYSEISNFRYTDLDILHTLFSIRAFCSGAITHRLVQLGVQTIFPGTILCTTTRILIVYPALHWWGRFAALAYTVFCAIAQVDTSTQLNISVSLAAQCSFRLLQRLAANLCDTAVLGQPETLTHSPLLVLNFPISIPFDNLSWFSLIFLTIPLIRLFILVNCLLLRRVNWLSQHLPAKQLCKPGPKSGQPASKTSASWSSCFRIVYVALTALIIMQAGGEGYSGTPWAGVEAASNNPSWITLFQAKHHGTSLQSGFGHGGCQSHAAARTNVQKRSFRRAVRRARVAGCAWYRGKCYTPDQFSSVHLPEVPQPKPKRKVTYTRAFAPRNRLQVCHVNVGGLSQPRLAEIKQWALMTEANVVILSETRWSFESEWTDKDWYMIHSGSDEDKANGILFLIRTTVCTADAIGFASIIPGRLGHLRIYQQHRSFDLIGCYQFADDHSSIRYQKRQEFWECLDKVVECLPNRNTILIAGDLNCSLPLVHPYVGTALYSWNTHKQKGPQHKDMDQLGTLLQRHRLVALNGWNAQSPPTFINGLHTSRIDHFLMRHADVDQQALDVKFFAHADFLPLSGAFHVPMLCSIRKTPQAYSRQTQQGYCTFQQRQQCRQEWNANTAKWQEFHHDLQRSFHDFTQQQHSPQDVIDSMHAHLMPTFHTFFKSCGILPKPGQPEMHKCIVQSKWFHRKMFLQSRSQTLQSLFRTWYHYGRYRTFKRQQQKQSKAVQRQKMADLMTEVSHAADNHDSFTVYQAVNKYTPKQPKRRIRLRLPNGAPASPPEILEMTRAYISEVWLPANTIDVPCRNPPGVPFSKDDLVMELARTPVTKSVARPCLPGLCWKTLAYDVADFIYPQLLEWWGQWPPFIPTQWKTAHLTFIHKPAKTPDRLSHLRPLALLEPVGKSILGLLTTRFAAEVKPLLCSWPQLAFLPQRSSFDAIRRVIDHCSHIRWLMMQQRRSVHQRAEQQKCWAVCGGVQVCLDASRAFDMVPRQGLFAFLSELDINQDLVALLAMWHSNTSYIITQGTTSSSVGTGRGVRQGCRAAPVLWSCYTLDLFYRLAQQLGPEWVKKNLTAFADDLHSSDCFLNERELNMALWRIGILLDTLEDMGLILSLEKSLAIISIGGTNCREVIRHTIHVDARGPHLIIPRAQGRTSRLPVCSHTKYLGIQIGYKLFEKHTIQHRIAAAHHTFSRLRRWLCNHRIRLKHRLNMWRACVFSTLMYGVFPVGFTYTDVLKMQQCIFKMYRAMIGDHSFITRHSHIQILHHFGLTHPLQLLLHVGTQLKRTIGHRLNTLQTDDILWSGDWTHLSTLTQLVHAVYVEQYQVQLQTPAIEVRPASHACQFCHLSFDSLPNLRRHQTNVHGLTQLRTFTATTASFAVRGLPHCSHCNEIFPNWRNFRVHLERNCCQALTRCGTDALASKQLPPMQADEPYPKLDDSSLTMLLSKPFGPAVLDCIKARCWDQLSSMPDALKAMTNHCILCGVYCGRPQDLNLHLRTQHGGLVPHVHSKASQLCRAQASNSPCRFCQREFRRSHQCPIMMQSALILINTDSTGTSYHHPGEHALRCDVCGLAHPDVQSLAIHLHAEHRLEPQDWDPLRDLLQGTEPVCSHCMAMFADKPAVRQHITLGQCPNFHPLRPVATLPISADWQEFLQQGDIQALRQAPMKRLALTLTCQLCYNKFQRTGDLSLHLQTVHSNDWHGAQNIVQLLLDTCQADGCICNPQTHASGLQHICVPYRQLGMMTQKMALPLFLPWQFNVDQILTFMPAVSEHPLMPRITDCLLQRHFSELWTDPLLLEFFRTTCMQCGLKMHPAELRDHIFSVHSSAPIMYDKLLPQILQVFHSIATVDHRCDACNQIFNHPLTDQETDMASRKLLAQIHFQHQCPVVLQLIHLLRCDYGDGTRTQQRGCGDAGHLQTPRPPSVPREVRQTRRRKRNQESQKRRIKKGRGNRGDGTADGNGATSSTPRLRPTSDEASRLLDLLHANRVPSHPAIVGDEGEGMEDTADGTVPAPGRSISSSEMLPGSTPCGHHAASPEQTGRVCGDGSVDGFSQTTWGAEQGQSIPIPAMESACPRAPSDRSAADQPEAHDQVCRAVSGDPEGLVHNNSIPFDESGGHRTNGALAMADIDACRRPPGLAVNPAGIDDVVTTGDVDEGSCTRPKQACDGSTGSHGERGGQVEVQRQDQNQANLQLTSLPTMPPTREALLTGLAGLNWPIMPTGAT